LCVFQTKSVMTDRCTHIDIQYIYKYTVHRHIYIDAELAVGSYVNVATINRGDGEL